MSSTNDPLLQRVLAIMPDLHIEQLEKNEEGLINDVLIVNQKLVFRFAKKDEYARLLRIEMKILDLIRPHIGISVPTPVFRSADCMVYPLLSGEPLSRKTIMGLGENAQNKIAEQLGSFLYSLHTTDVSNLDWELPATRAPVQRQRWLDIWGRVKEKIYPLLMKYQVEWADDLFNSVLENPESDGYKPALIHGDLASYHILLDDHVPEITGVIDFGMGGLGDPASDIGNLINTYGETFVGKMGVSYPRLEEHLPRARFYAQLLELEWVLLGFESGETFWFTAHLGGARDSLF